MNSAFFGNYPLYQECFFKDSRVILVSGLGSRSFSIRSIINTRGTFEFWRRIARSRKNIPETIFFLLYEATIMRILMVGGFEGLCFHYHSKKHISACKNIELVSMIAPFFRVFSISNFWRIRFQGSHRLIRIKANLVVFLVQKITGTPKISKF